MAAARGFGAGQRGAGAEIDVAECRPEPPGREYAFHDGHGERLGPGGTHGATARASFESAHRTD